MFEYGMYIAILVMRGLMAFARLLGAAITEVAAMVKESRRRKNEAEMRIEKGLGE